MLNSGLTPQCAIIVGTVRALKMHGGGPKVRPQLLGPDSGLVPVVWTNMLGVEAGLSHYISARHVCLLELQVSKSREKQTTEQNFALALAYDKKKGTTITGKREPHAQTFSSRGWQL